MKGHLFKTTENGWAVVEYNNQFEPTEYPVNQKQIVEAKNWEHWDYVVFDIEDGYAKVLSIEKTAKEIDAELRIY